MGGYLGTSPGEDTLGAGDEIHALGVCQANIPPWTLKLPSSMGGGSPGTLFGVGMIVAPTAGGREGVCKGRG